MSTQIVLPKFEVPKIPDTKQADQLSKSLLGQSVNLKIKDEDTFIASWALVERHDAAIAKVEEMFNPFVSGLHSLHKMAVELRDQFLTPLRQSKKILLDRRQVYRQEQDLIAKKKADEEAERLRKAQAKDLEKEAKQLERKGDIETAAVLREQASIMPAPVVPIVSAVPKLAGSVVKTSWKFSVENEALVPAEYRIVDEKKIRAVVNALGDKANIPGVKIWSETAEHSRAVR